MANKTKSTAPLLYSFDPGNGGAKGISTEIEARGPISFEPVIAPLTDKAGLERKDEKPRFSLDEDGHTLVFGVDDVYSHGKRTAARRLNSMSRYTSADYFRLIDVLFLQAFASYRGHNEYIAPTGVISLPVSQFNDPQVVDSVRSSLIGERTLVDYDGCELRLNVEDKRLIIMPESYGALMHWIYDPKLLEIRSGLQFTGTTVVVDIGYETTDCSLFEGTKYQRDQALTIPRAGMGVVSRQIAEWAATAVKGADPSWIDKSMRRLAGLPIGAQKCIEVAQGRELDVTEIYDLAVEQTALKIMQAVETAYHESPTRFLLAGGGALHGQPHFVDMMSAPIQVAPDAELANMLGAFTGLKLKARK